MEISVKNGNFGQKWKSWANIDLLAKTKILVKNRNFDWIFKFSAKNFGQISKFYQNVFFS